MEPTMGGQFTGARPRDRVQCLQWGLGSMLQWLPNKGTVVKDEICSSHQWEEASGSLSSSADLCQERESTADQAQSGQYDSCVLHKLHGWNQESISDEVHHATLEQVPAERYHSFSGTLTRLVECGSHGRKGTVPTRGWIPRFFRI